MIPPTFSTIGNIVITYINNHRYEYIVDLGAWCRIKYSKHFTPFKLLNWLKDNNYSWRKDAGQWSDKER